MQGSVRKKGATWSYRIELGMAAGKRNQVERSGFKTKSEATKAMNEVIYHYNMTGDFVENKKITFKEVYNEFIEKEAPATRAYATVVRYKSLYRNHLQESFDKYYMYQITPKMIDDFINEKMMSYSEEYVKGIFKLLKVLFGFAHKRQYTKKNIFPSVTALPDPRHVGEIKVYTAEERQAMETRLHGTNVIVAYYIALNTGLRESEVFGLRWEDIDFEKKKIKVCKQLLFQDRKWCFCPLKTKNAYRSVNITDSFCEYMKKLKKHHEENKKLYGDGYKRNFVTDRLERNRDILMEVDDFVNVKLNGDMLTTNSIKFMSRVIKKDLKIDFKFHNLRHPYVKLKLKILSAYFSRIFGAKVLDFPHDFNPIIGIYTHLFDKHIGKCLC